MSWLLIAIFAYFLLAVVSLVDKYLLTGPISSPRVYAFYVGILGILFLVFIPWVGFYIPGIWQIILALLAGAFFIYGLFWFFKALRLFEPSRIIPAIGGSLPVFTFLFIFIFTGGRENLRPWEFLAFILLLSGSILITYEKVKKITLKSFRIAAIAAFFLSLGFVLAKYVYMEQPFWPGFIWIRIGAFLMALCFLLIFFKEIKEAIFTSGQNLTGSKKIAMIFFSNQAVGASANLLQNWAIALAPLAGVAIINALQGIQYVFLLIFTIFLSLKFPHFLKEEISKKTIFQKIFAILLIGAGLALLTL